MKILYIDDHAESRLLTQHILEAAGYEVIEAGDGPSGIRAAEAEAPDLILIDIMMPGMDGREATTRLRGIPSLERIPIVALSAGGAQGDRERALAAGCDGYLQKPVDVDLLAAQVQAFLQGKRESLSPSQALHYIREHNKNLAARLDQKIQQLQDATESNKRLADRSLMDDLTDLPNRRCLIQRLREEFSIANRLASPLCCMMIEIDHFGSIVETSGRKIGDQLLQALSKVLHDGKRNYDVVGRYGNEVFLFLLPHASASGAMALAERLRQRVEALDFLSGPRRPIRFTISLGVATLEPGENLTEEAFLHCASQALSWAREGGRNRAVLFQKPV